MTKSTTPSLNHSLNQSFDHSHQAEHESKPFELGRLGLPHDGYHVQPGMGLASDGQMIVFQDGSTILEFRTLPDFESKRIHWRHGLIRDMIYSPHLGRFIMLTRDAVYSISGKPMLDSKKIRSKPLIEFPVSKFEGIRPFDDRHLFWRCTTVGKSLYIIYAGRGTVMEEYTLSSSECKVKTRWQPPKTCKPHEGIWCIRYHSETDQLGLTIMDSTTKQWRFEVRNREKFTLLWSGGLPLTRGDAEITAIPNQQWLIINSFGLLLAQISKTGVTSMTYNEELRGAIVIGDAFFIVRTKTNMDIHQLNLLQ